MTPESHSGRSGPEKGRASGHDSRRSPTKQIDRTDNTRWQLGSQAVAWYEVHEYRDRVLEYLGVERFPMVGTPAWCVLPDDHPVKIAAVIDAAQHWALRIDTAQVASCLASQAISAAADWSAIGQAQRNRAEFVAAKPWAKRVVDSCSTKLAPKASTETTDENTADNSCTEVAPEVSTETTEATTTVTWARRVIA
jgi:Protein of unknown function (DUF2742)